MKKVRKTKVGRVEKEIAALADMSDESIDFTDIPEVCDWRGAMRGRFYRRSQRVPQHRQP